MADLSDPRYWRPWRGKTRMSQCGRWSVSVRHGQYMLKFWPGGSVKAFCETEYEAMRVAEQQEREI